MHRAEGDGLKRDGLALADALGLNKGLTRTYTGTDGAVDEGGSVRCPPLFQHHLNLAVPKIPRRSRVVQWVGRSQGNPDGTFLTKKGEQGRPVQQRT